MIDPDMTKPALVTRMDEAEGWEYSESCEYLYIDVRARRFATELQEVCRTFAA